MEVDDLKFNYIRPENGIPNQECPKTLIDNLTLKDHKKLVIHQVARWLENIYTPTINLSNIPDTNS